jgi:hypothetical protein
MNGVNLLLALTETRAQINSAAVIHVTVNIVPQIHANKNATKAIEHTILLNHKVLN